ncbi:hypothetical protein BGZ57DRAFT_970362 [Hyaloscypha finlandica]|nr:hypothetical protein BGZ57DRAFT_970362 [Hyaloscypha finlandica]KAH8757149.1 hypothetical protein F5882DRAFT_468776 [Hyaloscypha sp. PMI_1271]
MSSKEAVAMDIRSPSFESVEYDSDTPNLLSHEWTTKQHKQQQKRNWAFLAVNTFVLLLNIGLLLMVSTPRAVTMAENTPSVRLPHADWIAPAVQLQLQTYDDKFEIHGRYRGRPRPELEAAWADYVRRKSTLIYFPSHCSFNTSTDYTLRVPKPGWTNATPNAILTEFQDEQGGIMGTFSYIHNIHCLKTIRQWMLPEYYPETRAQFPPTPETPIPRHIDHCIDMLRQSELCHADMTLLIFEWHEDDPHPVNIHHAPHICANPDKLERFLEEHTVPPIGPILKHPWTGETPWPFE